MVLKRGPCARSRIAGEVEREGTAAEVLVHPFNLGGRFTPDLGSYPGSAKSKMSAFVVEFRGPSNYGKAQVTYRVCALNSPGMNMQDTKCQEKIYHEVVRDLPQIFLTPMSKAFWLVLG